LNSPKTILIFTDWYIPGSKAGGPIQSVYNLALMLSEHSIVKIVCRDRDLDSTNAYASIKQNEWNEISKQHYVLYLSPENTNFKIIKSLIKENKSNILYINGLYSFYFSFLPVFLATIFNLKSVFISVRGMLHKSALSVKRTKKMIFIAFAKGYGLYKNFTLLSTNSLETAEIQRILVNQKVIEVPNIPINPNTIKHNSKVFKGENNQLRILFLGRLAPEKNPIVLLKALHFAKFNVEITFCGANYNDDYKLQFDSELNKLPTCIKVNTIGDIPHSELNNLFQKNDILALPSLGENFGHAIFESMAFGLPVIIGNNTPWKDLEARQAGFEIDPTNETELLNGIIFFNELNSESFDVWSINAQKTAVDYYNENNFEEIYLNLFNA
jgi:glycosyltransferase involved in cell wall biosynthesis